MPSARAIRGYAILSQEIGKFSLVSEDETSARSPFTTEMEARQAHLEALPGFQLKEDLEALKRCLYVFTTNANELAKHTGEFLNSLQLSQDVTENYSDELVRLLHNYLTSVSSLVESQRVVMRHRWSDGPLFEGNCPECDRPLLSADSFSEFESKDYAKQLSTTFETDEAAFIGKLRNYCTHYSIPLPTLGTTIRWEQGMSGVEQVNTLQLSRDKLQRWNGWSKPAKRFLTQQDDYFDLVPIIERYVNAAGEFAGWFWTEINARSSVLIDELNTKTIELNRWQQENVGRPDWFERGERFPPPNWSGKRWKLGLRRDRYRLGTRGFRLWAVDPAGEISLARDDDWTPLKLRYY